MRPPLFAVTLVALLSGWPPKGQDSQSLKDPAASAARPARGPDEDNPRVTPVPDAVIKKFSLDTTFYKKHVEYKGYSILGSAKVSDAALLEARYLIDQLLHDREDLLKAMIKRGCRFMVMAPTEMTTDVPEQRHLKKDPKTNWDRRARGLGGKLTSCGEENLLNLKGDRYHQENILIHEFNHAIHEQGLREVDPSFDRRLRKTYQAAIDKGLWKGMYPATDPKEYWAEGAQAYFDCMRPQFGANTREKLKNYDPGLFQLVDEVYRQSKFRYVRYDQRNRPSKGRAAAEAGAPALKGTQELAGYTTYPDFIRVMEAHGARYPAITHVSDPGTPEHPVYTGFFFYQCLQFDTTGRYLLGMKVDFDKRRIKPDDRAEIGFIDRQDQNKWTRIGETTAWNWQQGARLQWRPNSEEIVWNDRSDDGKAFVCRVYDFRTGKRRTLPRPIYDLSPEGSTALTHDFEGDHQGTDYAALGGTTKGPPSKTGIWKMNMATGEAELIMPLDKMAAIAFPRGTPRPGLFYIFREGWNPSGKRFITFVKDPVNKLSGAYSMSADGTDVRYLYHAPSHHAWLDDDHVFDFGRHSPPGGGRAVKGYYLFKDDGSGTAKELLWPVEVDDGFGGDGHGSFVPGTRGEWIISDTYNIHGFQYLFLFHRPTKLFVPLAKLKCDRPNDEYRVDTHPRLSRDGRLVSIDATYEGLGRQMYVIDIGHILDNPPGLGKASN